MWLDEIQTQFVRDRMQETPFADRGYIHDLYLIEQLHSGRRLGFAFHMGGGPQKLYARYPAEAECIRMEFQDGRYVDPLRFTAEHRHLADAWGVREKSHARARRQKVARERAAEVADYAAMVQQERDAWRRMGGGL